MVSLFMKGPKSRTLSVDRKQIWHVFSPAVLFLLATFGILNVFNRQITLYFYGINFRYDEHVDYNEKFERQ